MNIPEEVLREAAEAVKAAIENEDNLDWWNPEQDYWDRERGGLHTGVEGLIECTSVARAALSAAAPLLMAQALRETARDLSWFGAQGNLVEPNTAWAGVTACMNALNYKADELEQS